MHKIRFLNEEFNGKDMGFCIKNDNYSYLLHLALSKMNITW